MIEFLQKKYDQELARKDSILKAQSLSFVANSALLSGFFFVLTEQEEKSILFLIVEVVGLLLVALSLFFLFRSFSNMFSTHVYREHAGSKEILNYKRSLEKSEEFEKWLETELADCASHNFKINTKRTEDIAWSKRWSFAAFLVLVLLGVNWLVTLISQ
jgi:hypothetical protein